MDIRPYRLVGRSELDALRGRLEQVITRWSQEWLPAGAVPLVPQLHPLSTNDTPTHELWTAWSNESGPRFWSHTGRGSERALHMLMFGVQHTAACADTRSDMSWRAVSHAFDELLDALADASADTPLQRAGMPSEVPDVLWHPGSGGVRIEFETLGLSLLGSPQPLPRSETKPAPTPALRLDFPALVGDQCVALDVRAGGVEVPIARLMSLQIGDVLRLDSTLDEPLSLHGPDGSRLAHCALGRRGTLRAIQLDIQ